MDSKDIAAAYDRIAEDWNRDHQNDDWWVEGTDRFISELPEGAHVLDIGAGAGVKAKYLSARGLRVTGMDISKNLLEIARRRAPDAEFVLHSMYDFDTLPGTYDAAFAQASLLHIPKNDALRIVVAMATKIVPGGLVYLAVKEVQEGKPEEGMLVENDYGYEYERFFSYFTMDELQGYMEAAGLVILWQNRKDTGRTAWLQIIGRKS